MGTHGDKAFEGYGGTAVLETGLSGSGSGSGTVASPSSPRAAAVVVNESAVVGAGLHALETAPAKWYSYLATWDFWAVVLVGQVLSLCITATNTLTTELSIHGADFPAFQTLFNYAFLSLIYVPILFWQKGWRYVLREVLGPRTAWKYFVLSFLDVEGNYFTVLAYQYTNILSAQLLNFWSIVCVVLLSAVLLRVRYRPFQLAGIVLACGGMGVLLASDHITGSSTSGPTKVKGDLFGLLGASLYGVSNVFEEWFVSKRPAYEVLACLGAFGVVINGVQAAIFDRHSIQHLVWTGAIGGYLTGYTLCLTLFYTLAPVILRMASAAFFDISLLTANFWGAIIGIHVFGDSVHYLYPIAFVLILLGLVLYFLSGSLLGDAKKPWLGANQEDGVAGFGTAKLKALNAARKLQAEGDEGVPASQPQEV